MTSGNLENLVKTNSSAPARLSVGEPVHCVPVLGAYAGPRRRTLARAGARARAPQCGRVHRRTANGCAPPRRYAARDGTCPCEARRTGSAEMNAAAVARGAAGAETYRARGHRRLDARTYEAKCRACLWGCRMPVELIVDQWNPQVRGRRFETFCYGPKSCPAYRAGPTRKAPGRARFIAVSYRRGVQRPVRASSVRVTTGDSCRRNRKLATRSLDVSPPAT